MKKAKFLVSHFDAGVEKFKKGESYPLDDETRLCIVRGAAEEVDVPDEPTEEEKAAKAAAEAEATAKAAAELKAKEEAEAKAKAKADADAAKAKK